jgi:hypothetical protein
MWRTTVCYAFHQRPQGLISSRSSRRLHEMCYGTCSCFEATEIFVIEDFGIDGKIRCIDEVNLEPVIPYSSFPWNSPILI